ncbi:MAG: hypothetical protein JW748_15910 [Anaerolineales bacterium]|nr:hypothetical protein [Anaerolineales bacterium]
MNLGRRIRTLFWMLPATVALSCSMAAGAMPGTDPNASIKDLNAFLPPSSTPFLPNFASKTPLLLPSATMFPTVEITQTPTFTVIEILTATDPQTATLTIVILPSVTPTTKAPANNPPTKTSQPKAYPTATPKTYPTAKPTATSTPKTPTVLPATDLPATQTPTAAPEDPYPAPDDASSPTPTAVSEDPYPAPDDVNSPTPRPSATVTPTPTPTTKIEADPTNPFPGCTYTLNVDFENQIYERINQARTEAGLWTLSWYGPLAEGARYHSIDMGCNKYFAHTGGVYENILAGYNTVEQAWNWWWNSQAHHDNILGRYYYKTGVGYAWVVGSPYRYYWTIQFSR